MNNLIKVSLATAVMMSLCSVSAQAEDGVSIVENVKVKGEIRPRYEMVDQDNALSNANALTNRLVLGVNADLFGTQWLLGYAEMTDVHSLNNNYNSTNNGQIGHSVVVDPEQTRLTQAYLDFRYKKTLFRAGRQMVNLDNQRFVGAVGWRQMPQTFNAYALVDNTVENLNLMAAYVTEVNTIKAGAADSAKTESVLLNAKYKAMDELSVTVYDYMIGSTHDTYGISLSGEKIAVSDALLLNYRAEYAMQKDATMETNSVPSGNVDADYMNLELGMNMSGILAGLRYEVLSGTNGTDGKTAFTTPLATLHGQNGWADMFLSTPAAGLVDMNLMLGYKNKDLGLLKAVYHDFSSDVGSTDYGTELDVVYKRAITGVKGLEGMLKYADFSTDTAAYVDTQKFWVMLDYKFSN